jgi:hypothetical protein
MVLPSVQMACEFKHLSYNKPRPFRAKPPQKHIEQTFVPGSCIWIAMAASGHTSSCLHIFAQTAEAAHEQLAPRLFTARPSIGAASFPSPVMLTGTKPSHRLPC